MQWKDTNGKALRPLKDPHEIVDSLNTCVEDIGIRGVQYYLKTVESGQAVISNVKETIYLSPAIEEFSGPVAVPSGVRNKIEYYLNCLDFLQENMSHPVEESGNAKTFSCNNCYHNAKRVFTIGSHLHEFSNFPDLLKVELVFGYLARKIPFGTQMGNLVIASDAIEIHDWHTWNCVEEMLFDMTAFKNGGLLPPGSSIPDWGKADDHVYIFPPKEVVYRGIRFYTLDSLNDFVGTLFGL